MISSRPEQRSPVAAALPGFVLVAFDGAFVAHQSDPDVRLGDLLQHLPAALMAVRPDVAKG